MTHVPFPMLVTLTAAQDDATRARLLQIGGRKLLSDRAAVEAVAAAAISSKEEATSQAARDLLAAALDAARMAVENDVPEGAALIEAIATALTALDAARPFAPVLRLRLARVYAVAGLEPPPFATLAANPPPDDADVEMPDIDALLGPILRELGDTPAEAHAALSETLAGLPVELAAALVSMTVSRPGAVEARLGLYWLLDPRPDVRLSAATALLSRAVTGAMPADLAVLLPTIRKWLPEDGARAAVDTIIRRQMRDGSARHAAKSVTIDRAAASLPDGAGAQSLIAAVQIGSCRGVAMAMLKLGHGVKDAFILPCASATEQKNLLARVMDEIETHDLPPEALSAALARGLGEGLALDRLPAPGMVDMAEIWGPEALLPAAAGANEILATIGAPDALEGLSPARRRSLVQASADWLDRFEHLDSWFEDTGALRDAIARARSETGQETAVWKHLATRRDWWARIFSTSAAVMQAGDDAVWLSFAAVAQALIDGKSLKRLPIMEDILETTLEAWEARPDGGSGAHGRAPDGIDDLLAQAGISGANLHGYLVALAVSPRAPSPEVWLGALLGGIEFPGEGTLHRLMEAVVMRANLTDENVGHPEALAHVLTALNEDGFRDWAAGFDALVSSAKRSWPQRALADEDKRLLRAITKVAKGSEDAALLSLLPSWVARRHALRD